MRTCHEFIFLESELVIRWSHSSVICHEFLFFESELVMR